jgi:hypothetical protein
VRIGIHLLGAGSLGTTNQHYPARLAHLRGTTGIRRAAALLHIDPEIADRTGHSGRPAISSLLDVTGELDELWLVATNQRANPAASTAHRGQDTAPLARQISAALDADHRLYGAACHQVRVVPVAAVDANRVARRVAAYIRRTRRADPSRQLEVLLDAGPGAVAMFVGAYLGCVREGIAARLVQTNTDTPHEVDLSVGADALDRWLVRTGSFDAITSPVLRADHRLKREAALRMLDWPRAREAERELEESTVPAPGSTRLEDAAAYERFLRRSMLARAGLRDRSTYYLFRPWMTASFAKRVAQSEEFADLDLADIDDLLSRWNVEGASDVALAKVDRALRARHWQVARRQARESLHQAGDPAGDSSKEAVLALLKGQPVRERLDLEVDGVPIGSLLRGDRHLVVLPVGLHFDATMAQALDGFLRADDLPVLVHSGRTVNQAKAVRDALRLPGRRVLLVNVGSDVLANDLDHVRSAIRSAIGRWRNAEDAGMASVVCASGTKVMNLAALAEVLRFATENAVPVQVAWLEELASGGTQVAREPLNLARKVHNDRLVLRVANWALPDGDLPAIVAVCAMGSERWYRAGVLASTLTVLLTGRKADCHEAVRRLNQDERIHIQLDEPPALADLWQDRLAFIQRSVGRDPWGAIMLTTSIGEATWPPKGGLQQQGRVGTWADPKAYPASFQLWDWRNQSPFGHAIWADPPEEVDIREQLIEAAGEHRKGPFASSTPVGTSPIPVVLAALEDEIRRGLSR